jgi:TRAP-type C4-dicarboxylate transport system permease small subunit
MNVKRLLPLVKPAVGLGCFTIVAKASAQRVLEAASAASDAIVVKEPPGYPYALYAFFGFLAFLGLLALLAIVNLRSKASRDNEKPASNGGPAVR